MLGRKRERAYVWTRARKGFSSSCYSIDNLLCGGHEGKNALLIIDFSLLQKGLLLCIGLEYCSANIQPPPPLPGNEVYFPIFGLGHMACFGHQEINGCDRNSSFKYA